MLRLRLPASLFATLLAVPALAGGAWPEPRERQALAMGTVLRLSLEPEAAPALAEGMLAEIDRIERACSTWDLRSGWSRLNAAGGGAVPLEAEWIELLTAARAWSGRTGGAFDPVLGALLRAWGIREGGRIPDAAELAAARAASGTALLELDPAAGSARLRDPHAGVEEGGFLKGYALDAARRVALAGGSRSGWLDFGGQLLAWGRPLVATIADPAARGRPQVALRLRDASLSTSGCSERGRHILDPRSGRPCEAWGSVSVVAPSGFDADVLSTALYVLGPVEGLAWAEAHSLPALFLFADGRHRASTAFTALHPTYLPGDAR